jgi:hypothetical protein
MRTRPFNCPPLLKKEEKRKAMRDCRAGFSLLIPRAGAQSPQLSRSTLTSPDFLSLLSWKDTRQFSLVFFCRGIILYLEYQSVCFLRPNWLHPPPLKRVCPPRTKGGLQHSLAGERGRGGANSRTTGKKAWHSVYPVVFFYS